MINWKGVKAVIFDMDGVLINSEPFWKQAEIRVFESVGIDFLAVGGEQTVGLRIDEVVGFWHAKYPWKNKSKAAIVKEIMDEMVAIITSKGEPLSGVNEILLKLKENNIKIGLASSSYGVLIDATLSRLNIGQYFDYTLSAENLAYGKPHPEVYLNVAEQLKHSPSECLVIEDSLNGILAAKAAKMQVAAIPDGTHSPEPKIIIADQQLKSLDELLKIMQEEGFID